MAAEFNVGDRVKVVQKGTITVGGAVLTDNTFQNVRIVSKNPDGSYGVRLADFVRAPRMDNVTVPAEWVHPAGGA